MTQNAHRQIDKEMYTHIHAYTYTEEHTDIHRHRGHAQIHTGTHTQDRQQAWGDYTTINQSRL